MEGILLYLPYALAILTEFGAILSLNYGLSAPPPPVAAPRHSSRVMTDDLVTIADIAKGLGMSANVARGILRAKKVARPTQGWAWSASDAVAIKALLHRNETVVPFQRRA